MTTSSSTPPFSEVFTPWLLEVDPSGSLLNYTAALENTYDTVSQIVKLYYNEDGHYEMFFDDLGVENPEHQRPFLACFATTAAETEGASSSQRPPLEPPQELEAIEGGGRRRLMLRSGRRRAKRLGRSGERSAANI